MITKLAMPFLMIALLACGDTVSPNTVVSGVWTYAGTQVTPSPATLSGTVTWKGVAGGDQSFEGTFTLIEQLPTGSSQTLTGPGAGEVLADTIADFNLTVDGLQRQHIGVLRGDSISGNWAVLDASQNASGTFVLHRSQ